MSNRAKALLLLFIDSVLLVTSLLLVLAVRKGGTLNTAFLIRHFNLFLYLFPLWILMYFIEGLYTLKTYNPANLQISLIRGTALSLVASFILIYLLPNDLTNVTPKTNLVLIAVAALPLLYTWRLSFFKYFSRERRLRNTFIVGSQETLDLVKYEIGKKPHLGYKIISSCTPEEASPIIPQNVQLIAIERQTSNHELYKSVFAKLGSGVEVMDLARFAEQVSGKIPINAIDESWFIEYCGHQESRSYDILKTLIDKTVAILLLIILIIPAIFIIPVLLIVHGRPIFFKQIRTGLNNKPFKLYKLRTMVIDAEKDGAQWAKPKDARITPLGRILRKTRLDELPQLINIIRGEMSLVGPRPERPEIIADKLAPNIPYYALRHLVKPGVTGWAQVTFRYGFSQEDSKEKLQFDLFYVKNRNLWLDIIVIIRTVKTVITGAGQ